MNDFCIAFAELSDISNYETAQVVSISLVPVVKNEVRWASLLHIPAIRPMFGATFSYCSIPTNKLVDGIDVAFANPAVRDFYKKHVTNPMVLNDLPRTIYAVRKLFYAQGGAPYYSDTLRLDHKFLDYDSLIAGNKGFTPSTPSSIINMVNELIPILKLTEKKA